MKKNILVSILSIFTLTMLFGLQADQPQTCLAQAEQPRYGEQLKRVLTRAQETVALKTTPALLVTLSRNIVYAFTDLENIEKAIDCLDEKTYKTVRKKFKRLC